MSDPLRRGPALGFVGPSPSAPRASPTPSGLLILMGGVVLMGGWSRRRRVARAIAIERRLPELVAQVIRWVLTGLSLLATPQRP
ncbi:hypothetical protein BE17_18095 [Sorangium cellulosum]|uniref:PEP-CTERM protein-sorting domain-containing protein n=1 Tax=Sorangium cellulosum TaxID=56 RepID=A0A150R2T2_SORCE|nr:hypothetical protein BE17_18095 [Sorangium cellulosum]